VAYSTVPVQVPRLIMASKSAGMLTLWKEDPSEKPTGQGTDSSQRLGHELELQRREPVNKRQLQVLRPILVPA